MNRILLSTLLVLTGLFALLPPTPSHAQSPVYTPTALPIFPYRGMYYEPGHGGTGLTVDIDNNGYIFAVFYTYTPAGQPTFLLMEGKYQPKSEAQRISTGLLGTFEATPYISENGECVGPGCTYKSPTRTATNLSAKIEWTASRTATLTIDGQTWHLKAGQYSISDADALLGQWFFNGVWSTPGSEPRAPWGALVISKHTGNLTAANFSRLPFISPDALVYDVTWKRIPLFNFVDAGDHFYALYNPQTGRIDIVQGYFLGNNNLSSISIMPFAVLYLDGPQMMRGRHESPSGARPNPANYSQYSVFTDITLVRSHPLSMFLDQTAN